FRTVYAHLTQALVSVGQQVKAGDKIGLADSTGNSFGSHLHITLKLDGAQTPGYPAGIIDPWPYFQGVTLPTPATPTPPATPTGLKITTTDQLNLRAAPSSDGAVLSTLQVNTSLSVLEDANGALGKIGRFGQWMKVQTSGNQQGYVAAWYVQADAKAAPASNIIAYTDDQLNLRSAPTTTGSILKILAEGEALTLLESIDTARSKIGLAGQWLNVRTTTNQVGYVSAQYVHLTGQAPAATTLMIYATDIVNVRIQPAVTANSLTIISAGESLTVVGDTTNAQAEIGQANKWVNVKTRAGFSGFVDAAKVSLTPKFTTPATNVQTLIVYPIDGVNVRAQASTNSPIAGTALKNSALTVIESDPNAAKAKIGQQSQWVFVRTATGISGWVAAWLLSLSQS
ncbi:MAG TPA: M23 family metallopeptidase, partial [Anaerolineae bacterium]|nr:M23 family metallopeptidase [Anaerolineae bacterium]